MKKIYNYFGIFLSAVLAIAMTACSIREEEGSAEVGLGIKVFAPTKVVAGQPMTINGSGFRDVTEIVFPGNVSVSQFELVSGEMIRVNAPAGISAEGGKLIVRTAADQAESKVSLTLGKTVVSGYSKQEGETAQGGEQITIFGQDLEFITGVELLDADGNPQLIEDRDFFRKSTNTLIFTVPNKVFDGTFVGKVYTVDGQVFNMPSLKYEPGSEGGHWEIVETTVWEGDGSAGAISWSGQYRFAGEGHETGEEIYAFPADVWEQLKSETFYVLLEATDPQIRVTTGWWSTNLTADDIFAGNELLTDNENGTFTLEVTLANAPDLLALVDDQHLLLTGDRYTPLKIFFRTEEWVEGGGHWEIVKTSLWKGDGSAGAVSWSGQYRFAGEGHETGEEIYAFPTDVWEQLKSETFYVLLEATDPQIRVTTGWWSTNLTTDDIFAGNELLTDNGDGTFTLEVTLANAPDLLALLDDQHLLLTGDRYTPLEIFFQKEVWVDGGGGSAPQEVLIWENDGSHGSIAWSGDYRFAGEGHETGEEIYIIPADQWAVIMSGTFFLQASIDADWYNLRITTGWWSSTWTGEDIGKGNERIILSDDGTTFTLEINFGGDPLLDYLDVQHLLFTGEGYTPLKIYYYE